MRGYKAGRFSFNVKGGRCEACQGDGVKKIEMHFLPDVYVPCEVCDGRRFNEATLEVRYRGRSIADVLDMRSTRRSSSSRTFPAIRRCSRPLADVGLGYITLGQSSTTLSGGEAQRVKLAAELSKRSTGRTLYILDEPTTGLHFDDIRKLLARARPAGRLGNTVLVIEHNLDVIKSADWIIDLGPEGGDAGGQVVAEGTPEQVAGVRGSYTGRFLARCCRGLRPVALGDSSPGEFNDRVSDSGDLATALTSGSPGGTQVLNHCSRDRVTRFRSRQGARTRTDSRQGGRLPVIAGQPPRRLAL